LRLVDALAPRTCDPLPVARPWAPFVPVALLLAAGAGFGVLGARAIRLEGGEAARRARARAEETVQAAASVAPTRAAGGLGTSVEAFTLVSSSPRTDSAVAGPGRLGQPSAPTGQVVSEGQVVPDDVRLLL